MKPFLDKSALLISAITSPFVVITIVGAITISYYASNIQELLFWNGIFITFTIILPLLYIAYGVRIGRFTDLHLMVRKQRLEPFLVSLAGSILLLITFYLLEVPKQLIVLATIMLANGIVFLAITQFWKISIHSATLAGSITITAILIDSRLAILYLISPLAIWARIRRQRHNFLQGLVATFLAILIAVIIFKFYRII